MRVLLLASVAAALATCAPAFAQSDDEADALVTECSPSGLTADQVASCLVRTRTMEENNPSPELQALEAQLQDESDQSSGSPMDGSQAPDDQSEPGDQMQQGGPAPADDAQAPDEQAQPDQIPPDESAQPDQTPNGDGDDQPESAPNDSAPPQPDSAGSPQG